MFNLTFRILLEDIINSNNDDVENCAVCKAIKRSFPYESVIVGSNFCMIGEERISLPRYTMERLWLMDNKIIKANNFTIQIKVSNKLYESRIID